MSRYLYIIAMLCLLACAPQSARAQGQLSVEPSEWNFGAIREDNGKVSCTFTAQNSGDKPLVILDIVANCGCTAPQFSKQPLLPGAKTQIKVTFDPANRPGSFAKELYVYSSDREKIATLVIRGQVEQRERSLEELYPIDGGGGLRLSTTTAALSYIAQGQSSQTAIGYVNASKKTISLELRPTTSSGLLMLNYPRQIAAGQSGEINVGYTIPSTTPRYGTLRDVLEVWVNSQSNSTQLLVQAIGIDPILDPERAPKIVLSSTTIKFGVVKFRSKELQRAFTITNSGASPLIFRSIESDDRVECSLKPGTEVQAGASLEAFLTLRPNKQEFGILSSQISIITNDPARPYLRLRATAIIED